MRFQTIALLALISLSFSRTSSMFAVASPPFESGCAGAPPCPKFSYSSWSTYSFSNLIGMMAHPQKCSRSQYDYSLVEHQREVSHRLGELLGQVVGQDHVIKPVKQRLIAKLVDPSKPLVLLFTGDNGVGKTMTANLISLAMSLRCGSDEDCQTGDAALTLTASESNVEARSSIVKRIANHATRYPRGLVVLNEVLLLNPEVAESLAPLFGRGRTFHDHPHASLHELTVILTSDFGKHVAVTQGKTAAQIAQLTKEAFAKRFGLTFASEMSSHAFLPLSYENAVLACRRYILNLPCRNKHVHEVEVSKDVAERIVTDLVHNGALSENNAREITKAVEVAIDGTVGEIFLSERFPVGAKGRVTVTYENKAIVVRVVTDLGMEATANAEL